MKFSHMTGAARILVGIFLGVFAYANFGPQPEPEYRDVIVSVPQIETVERVDTVVTWRERIVYVTQPAEQIATAPGGGADDVERFCGPVETPADSVNPTPARPPALLIRSVRHEPAWFFGRDKLVLTGPLSTGDLQQRIYRTRAGYQFMTHGDSVIMQYPRSALLRDGAEAAIYIGAGFLLRSLF